MVRLKLAWLNLVTSPKRFLVSVGGIAGAVVLMLVEFGFLVAMFDSQTHILQVFQGDLFLLSGSSHSIAFGKPFPLERVAQARAVSGVRRVTPVYLERGRFALRNPETGRRRPIRVIAFEPREGIFRNESLQSQVSLLRPLDQVLYDERSKEFLGRFEEGDTTELGRTQVTLGGTFSLGSDFVNDGNILASGRTYERLFRDAAGEANPLQHPHLGLVELEPGHSLEAVVHELSSRLPEDTVVVSRESLLDRERAFWRKNTIIGFVFTMATIVGFVVGFIVCSQILYTGVSEYLHEYGILKALGYSSWWLAVNVLEQASLLAVAGFIPGSLLSLLVYHTVEDWTGLTMTFSWLRVVGIFAATWGMCIGAALLAVRQVWVADPAEVFK